MLKVSGENPASGGVRAHNDSNRFPDGSNDGKFEFGDVIFGNCFLNPRNRPADDDEDVRTCRPESRQTSTSCIYKLFTSVISPQQALPCPASSFSRIAVAFKCAASSFSTTAPTAVPALTSHSGNHSQTFAWS